MADRVTKVSLILQVSEYLANAEKAAQKTRDIGTEAEKAAQKGRAIETLGPALLSVGAIAGVAFGLVVSKAAEFDKAMSGVQAATHESAATLGLLREAALQAGADTVFSATEAAQAEEELAKAGVSASDVIGGALSGSLDLASAGSLGVADAASIAATAMTQFRLSGAQVPHVADLLSAGAGKAQGSVQDLSAALNQGGLVAAQAGFSIEDTTATLAAFASAGLIGSDAGTALKTALLSLEAPSNKAQELMRQYGINIYDANGKMLSFSGIAGQLQTKLGGLTDEQRNSALATIFGTDAVRAASVLYSQGSAGIDSWNDKVNDSGYAAETARIKMDNLSGDVEQLGGSFDTALIKSGSGANEVLRSIVQSATGLVNAIGSLPAPVLEAGVGLLGLVAGVGTLGGGFISILPKISATKLAMQELNLTGKNLIGIIGKGGAISLGLAALTNGFTAMSEQVELSDVDLARLQVTLKEVTNLDTSDLNSAFSTDDNFGFLGYTKGVTGFKEALDSLTTTDLAQWIDGTTFGLSGVGNSADKTEANFRQLDLSLAELAKQDFSSSVSTFQKYVEALGGGDEAALKLLNTSTSYKAELVSLADTAGIATDDQSLLNLALGRGGDAQQLLRDETAKSNSALADMSAAAQDTSGNVKDLSDQIKNFGSAQFDTEKATDSLYAAFDSLDKIISSGEGSLDRTTEAGRKTSGALLDVASSTNDLAAATYAQTGSQEQTVAVLEQGRQKLIEFGIRLGYTSENAKTYADSLIAIPSALITQVQANTDGAIGQINSLIDFINSRAATITVNATRPNIGFGLGDGRAYGGTVGFAGGGTAYGPGTAKSDSILTRLSVGEEVIQQPYAGIFRTQLKDINRGRVPVYMPGPAGSYIGSDGGSYGQPRSNNINMNVNGVVDPTVVSSLVFQRLKAGMAG